MSVALIRDSGKTLTHRKPESRLGLSVSLPQVSLYATFVCGGGRVLKVLSPFASCNDDKVMAATNMDNDNLGSGEKNVGDDDDLTGQDRNTMAIMSSFFAVLAG